MQKLAYEQVSSCGYFQSLALDTADAVALPHPENSFDIAIMMHKMYHVTDPKRAMAIKVTQIRLKERGERLQNALTHQVVGS
jgi:ubiquinone/menaquinone biosynthesis C-methylase UbiE